MAGVVASNVRSNRAKSQSLKSNKEEGEVFKKLQIKQEQIELNKQWKQKVKIFNFKTQKPESKKKSTHQNLLHNAMVKKYTHH